jgi:hypothetical protein
VPTLRPSTPRWATPVRTSDRNELFGDAGAHARSAVGMAELPFNLPVELEAEVKVKA